MIKAILILLKGLIVPVQTTPTLVYTPVEQDTYTAVVLFIGQDWKKFRVEATFIFSALADALQVLHRLH